MRNLNNLLSGLGLVLDANTTTSLKRLVPRGSTLTTQHRSDTVSRTMTSSGATVKSPLITMDPIEITGRVDAPQVEETTILRPATNQTTSEVIKTLGLKKQDVVVYGLGALIALYLLWKV